MSSVVGVSGNAGQSNYFASKAGMIAPTKSIAQELEPRNIRCNVVNSGFIETEMTAKLPDDVRKRADQWYSWKRKKWGRPTIRVYLASDLSSYVTGREYMRLCAEC